MKILQLSYSSHHSLFMICKISITPDLLVKVKRHKRCTVEYRNEAWNLRSMDLKDDLSELLQHEHDHLDGVLAVMRAIDGKSFSYKDQK